MQLRSDAHPGGDGLRRADGPGEEPAALRDALLARAREITDLHGGAFEELHVRFIRGCAEMHRCEISAGLVRIRDAQAFAEEHCPDNWWIRSSVIIYRSGAEFFAGNFAVLTERLPAWVAEARRRGDQFLAGDLNASWAAAAWLGPDDVAGMRRHLDEAERFWVVPRSYQWSNFFMLTAVMCLALYTGDPLPAFHRAEGEWRALERSQLLRLRVLAAMAHLLRGGCALSVLDTEAAARPVVSASVRALSRLAIAYGDAFAEALRGALALRSGSAPGAIRHLRQAVAILEGSDARMYAAAARRRLGQLLGGDEGAALLAEGDAAMRGEGVVNLDAMTEMLIPGCHRP